MPEGPGAVQTLPIGCISLARRYMHFGGPIRRTGRPSEGHQCRPLRWPNHLRGQEPPQH